jgi:GNAT superfamily N-acetyltransferase
MVPQEEAASVVVPAQERDWRQLRSVRLAALADSPSAFGSTLASEQEYDEQDWRAWTREAATFLAFAGEQPIGMAAGIQGLRPDERRLIAMWVRPGSRGEGVAAALVAAVRDWAHHDGAVRLTLSVTRTNEPAVRLYRRLGFLETGASKPLPSNPALVEDELALDLR